MQPIIETKNLSVTYFLGRRQEVRALQDVSISIYPGEFVIFFGPSGCGKSTLLYSIAGLETHARGAVTVDGHAVTGMKAEEAARFRQKSIGMIFQAFYLIPSLSVQSNVLLPQMAVNAVPEQRTARVRELLERFGVLDQAGKFPLELSGGQQQRVAICRAAVNDPDILLADEPVGNLDSKSAGEVIRLIHDLHDREHKTVILVTHDPSHLHLADRVFTMRDGRIIQTKVQKAVTPEVTQEISDRPDVPPEMAMLLRTFTGLEAGQAGAILLPYKAKEIVAETLTGLATEEIERIEREVQEMLLLRMRGQGDLSEFLNRTSEAGGVGLQRRTAEKLAARMEHVLDEIRMLEAEEHPLTGTPVTPLDAEELQLRQFLVETFDLHLEGDTALRALDIAVTERLRNGIDSAEFFHRLDKPVREGGVGLDRRTARKVTRELDLVLLGKFQG